MYTGRTIVEAVRKWQVGLWKKPSSRDTMPLPQRSGRWRLDRPQQESQPLKRMRHIN